MGVAAGYGGAGIVQPVLVNGSQVSVSRSEGPGMLDLFVEDLLTDHFSLGFEYEMGYRLGPFSSGAFFTGLTGRYYFFGPAPSTVQPNDGATLFIGRYAFFVGFGYGLAEAHISRLNDQVPTVNGSGIYLGTKLGCDYMLSPHFGIRPEISYALTFFSQETPPTQLTEFAVQLGFVYFL
jgi:hypothetical protein